MNFLEALRGANPAAADEYEALVARMRTAKEEAARALEIEHAATAAVEAAYRQHIAAVRRYAREATMPQGEDAFVLVRDEHGGRRPDPDNILFRATWAKEPGRSGLSARVDRWEWSQTSMEWRAARKGVIWIRPNGVRKGGRKPTVTPERLAEICGGDLGEGRGHA